MGKVTTNQIRNICLLGHGGSGKTSLAESMLFLAKASDRLGNVPDGNTVCDFEPEEIKRQFSISSAVANCTWKDCKINIIDTPGFFDFVGEVLTGLRVADSAIITVDAKSGIQVGTELAYERATAAKLPISFFINKSDDPEANFEKVFDNLTATFGNSVCPIIIPGLTPASFINLIDLKKYEYKSDGSHTEAEIAPEYKKTVDKYREKLFEAIATTSDELMTKFFDGEEITKEEAVEAIHMGIIEGTIIPVFSGSATKLWGVESLLDTIADSFPRHTAKKVEKVIVDGKVTDYKIEKEGAPSIFIFKTSIDQYGRLSYFKVMSGELSNTMTLKNKQTDSLEKFSHFYTVRGKKQTEVDTLCAGDIGVIMKLQNTNTNNTLSLSGEIEYAPPTFPEPYYTMALQPKIKGEEEKIALGIYRILDEDCTLRFENNAETKQLLLSGIGDMHLDVVLAKLKVRNSVSVNLVAPKIAYRETIRKKVQAEGKHKKQTGGHGQYGHVKINFGPGEADGLTFTQSVVGGAVPKGYFPAVEKGLLECMQKGVLAGYPVVNLAADLYDGSYHDVDSNELSFKMAAALAYKAGLPKANPILLEPVGILTVSVPEAIVGDIMGDLNGKRRASVLGMTASLEKKGYTVIEAEVPRGEMVDYAISLRAMSQGKGTFTYKQTRYDEVPAAIAQKIIAASASNTEEE